MDHHPGRLVDHEQRIVLVDDRDGDVLSGDRPLLYFRDLDAHDVPGHGPITRLLWSPTYQDVPLRDQSRRLSARQLGPLGNKEVEADIAVRLDQKLFDIAQT